MRSRFEPRASDSPTKDNGPDQDSDPGPVILRFACILITKLADLRQSRGHTAGHIQKDYYAFRYNSLSSVSILLHFLKNGLIGKTRAWELRLGFLERKKSKLKFEFSFICADKFWVMSKFWRKLVLRYPDLMPHFFFWPNQVINVNISNTWP